MSDPGAELERAVLAALEPLVGDLSSGRADRSLKRPRIGIGRTQIRDWSSGAETGEHLLTVHVRSKEENGAEHLAKIVRGRLAEGLDLGGGRVARLRLEFAETRNEEEFSVHHGLLRFRASIEEVEG
jgi:hypothetical protein